MTFEKLKHNYSVYLNARGIVLMDDYSIRLATPEDKEAVLNIRRNVYGGRDYLPDYYDDFMTSPNVTPFVLCHKDKIVSIVFLLSKKLCFRQLAK